MTDVEWTGDGSRHKLAVSRFISSEVWSIELIANGAL